MTRAYIRLDPAFDERKESYPDGPYAALIATFCLAEHQPEPRTFFEDEHECLHEPDPPCGLAELRAALEGPSS